MDEVRSRVLTRPSDVNEVSVNEVNLNEVNAFSSPGRRADHFCVSMLARRWPGSSDGRGVWRLQTRRRRALRNHI